MRRYNLELDDDLLDDEQDNELHATPRRESAAPRPTPRTATR